MLEQLQDLKGRIASTKEAIKEQVKAVSDWASAPET
jgi:hypothetical protein